MNELIKLLLENDIVMAIEKEPMPNDVMIMCVRFTWSNYHKRVLIDAEVIEASRIPMETILYSHADRFMREIEPIKKGRETDATCENCRYYAPKREYDVHCSFCNGARNTASKWQPKED